MADFCKACSVELFGKDFHDLAGLRTEGMVERDTYPVVICEGCGHINVDVDGNCVSSDCLLAGQPGHNVPTEEGK